MIHLLATALVLPAIDYTTILPELILLGWMLVLLAVSALVSRTIPTEAYAAATSGAGIASLIASLILWHDVQDHGASSAIAHAVAVDGFTCFVYVLISCVVILAPFFGASFLRREQMAGPEYYVLALIAAAGAMLMGSADDLILIFLGLEVLSLPLYVMAGFDHRSEGSTEAAMKYFVLGAFSSAVFVYGIALTYGATGSINLAEIGAFLARNTVLSNGVLLAGLVLLIAGFGFKIAAVPFHMWTPDVYEGSPTPAVGFMAAVAKVGGFAALLRVLFSSYPTLASDWQPILWILATATLLTGAVVALVQRDVKRMLAYSSINHAGFVLLGVQAATERGRSGALYYLFAYALLVLGSFAVVAIVGGRGDEAHDLESYRGLGRRAPTLAIAFAVLLLAQAGAPFTTGFFAKFYVVAAAVDAHSYALAVIAMVSASIAVFFYLRVVLLMFGEAPAVDEEVAEQAAAGASGGGTALALRQLDATRALVLDNWALSGLGIVVLATLFFGIWPQPLVSFAHDATLLFR